MNSNASSPVQYIRNRVANACDTCKARKVKCDGKFPCSHCVRRQRSHSCHYSPQRRRQRRQTEASLRGDNSPSASETTLDAGTVAAVSSERPTSSGENPVEDDTEVPREARLLCDAQGKLVFIGDCAPLSFFQSVRQLVTAKVGQNVFAQQSVLENASAHNSRRSLGAQHVPEVRLHHVGPAISSYLSTTTALIDLFDPEHLHHDLMAWADLERKPDDAVSIVNFLILAIGRQIDDEGLAHEYFEYARDRAFVKLSGHLSVGTVQAFTLITVHMLCSCQITGAFLFFGIAVRAACSVGIHRTEVNARFGLKVKRQRDRLWKSLRIVDLFFSTTMGRPPATSDVDCTVPYHETDDHGNEVYDLLNASVQIFLITERIVVEVYSRRKISLKLTEGISLQLREWSDRWLKQLKMAMASGNQSQAQISGACQVLSTYYYAVMLVSRPFLMYETCRRLSDNPAISGHHTPTSGKSKLADACIDAATLMIDPIQELIDCGVLDGCVPILVSWIFASSLVLGLGLLSGFGRILERYTRMAITALDHFSKHDAHATQYSLIAQSLRSTALDYIEKREMQERMQRTEVSSQLFGLILANSDSSRTISSPTQTALRAMSPETSTTSAREIAGEPMDRSPVSQQAMHHVSSPRFGDLSTSFLGLGEPFLQTLDADSWDANFGMEGDSASALNLFPLLDAGGGIDLAHHF